MSTTLDSSKTRSTSYREALTEQRVAKLLPLTTTYYANDARTPGLSVRVTRMGVKSYVYTKKIKGRLFRLTLGKVGSLRLEDARKAVEARNGELAKGTDIAALHRAEKIARSAAFTLDQAFERYMASKTHKATTAKDYRTLWRVHVPTRLKQRPIGEVSSIDVERLRDVIGAKAQRTANKVVGLIGAVMTKSGRWADNPARGVGRFNEEMRTRRLSQDELKRLWAALDADAGMWADFFKLLVLTGARRSALCAMRWEDLDLETGLWTVPATWSKNGRELAIPLTSKAVDVLSSRRSYRSNSRWVWPSVESATGHVVNPEKPWRRFLLAADITSHTTLHDVRRTLGSQLARSGAASATITKALGHLSSQSARAYVHLDAAPVRNAIEKVYGALGDA